MELKVGDELLFTNMSTMSIRKIDKITPSGRLVCGKTILNPNLSVRGHQDIWNIITVAPVTDKDREDIKDMKLRKKCMDEINDINWRGIKTDQLKRIVEIINETQSA